jgi:hypothetical protein
MTAEEEDQVAAALQTLINAMWRVGREHDAQRLEAYQAEVCANYFKEEVQSECNSETG